jgi:hypothetical protein
MWTSARRWTQLASGKAHAFEKTGRTGTGIVVVVVAQDENFGWASLGVRHGRVLAVAQDNQSL